MHHPMTLIPLLLAAFWRQPRAWIALLVGMAVLLGGFHYRLLPGSQIITSQGLAVAALALGLASMVLVLVAARVWLMLRPQESPSYAVERTCLSYLFAAIVCLFASIGPNAVGLYAQGRFVRLNILVTSFLVCQLAWMFHTESRVWQRLKEVWRTKDLGSWQDATLFALGSICLAETATYLNAPYIQVTPFALVLNVTLLTAVMLIVWALLGRGLFAIVLTVGCYFALSFANAMKLKYLYAGLQPGDHAYLGEVLYFKGFFEPKLLAIVAVLLTGLAGLLVWAWRSSTRRWPLATRLRMSIGGFAALIGVAGIPWIPGADAALSPFGIVELNGQSATSCERHGLLFELALHLPDAYLPTPADYSQAAIAKIIHAQKIAAEAQRVPVKVPAADVGQKVNIAIFQFESLMNPSDFGLPLQREVLPNLTKLNQQGLHGYAISPRGVNGSAESEFEVLTGMSSGFLPPNTSTYKHFIKDFVPSLVSLLHRDGYEATAIKCVSPGFFNFQEAYGHLTFDRFRSVLEFTAPSYYAFSGHLSDTSFVNEMLQALAASPVMVVGENLGSHAPFSVEEIADRPRFLAEPPTPASDRIEAYLQAIARTDEQLGRLVEELAKRPERVVLLVMGDHHPPLPADSHAYDVPAFHAPGPPGELFRRRVPFVIWKNFESNLENSTTTAPTAASGAKDETYISMNFLSLLLLREAGILPEGLIAWNQELFEQCPVVSRNLFYTEGQAKSWDELSPGLQQRIREYELLQYDLLIGENYSEKQW